MIKNLKLKNKIWLAILFGVLIFPGITKAMDLTIEKTADDFRVGDTVLLNVFINSDGQEINAIDGALKIDGDFEMKSLNTAGSVFNIWPTKPTYENNSINFIGGVVEGANGNHLKVFSIAIKPKTVGNIRLISKGITIYLGDGNGTAVPVNINAFDFKVFAQDGAPKDELLENVSADKTIPDNFEILIGRDDNVFEGKYFASFGTTDDESGIDRYEVLEEGFGPVEAENVYVLKNQDLSGKLSISAIDNAGNVRTVTVQKSQAVTKPGNNWFVLIVVIVLLIVVWAVNRLLKKKKSLV